MHCHMPLLVFLVLTSYASLWLFRFSYWLYFLCFFCIFCFPCIPHASNAACVIRHSWVAGVFVLLMFIELLLCLPCFYIVLYVILMPSL